MPYNATLHRLHKKLTRAQLERRLRDKSGRTLYRPENIPDPTFRRNHKWATWKQSSKDTPNGKQCVLRNLVTGKITTGPNWHTLAKKVGLV